MVVLTHAKLYEVYNLGAFAVNVFFVISGFLITLLLIGETERTEAVSLKHFYIRRTLRIFPAFYLSWAATLATGYVLHKPYSVWEPVATFFYMGDYFHALYRSTDRLMGVAWSLGVEEKFYVLWPAVFVMLRGRWSTLFKGWPGNGGALASRLLVLLHRACPVRLFE